MLRKVRLAAIPLLLATPVLAQSADQAPAGSGMETPPPPAAADTGTDSGATPGMTGAETAAPDGAAASGDVQIMTRETENQILVADIVGMDVVDAAGNKLGKVDDVVLDKSGQVAGLVVSAGEILGLGGKTVAVSWQDVAAADDADSITLNLTEEQLTAAPEFQTELDQLREQTHNAPASPQ